MIQGVAITVDREAVVVRAGEPLAVLSSAVVGGFSMVRAIVNLHVPRSFRCEESERVLAGRGEPAAWMTSTINTIVVVDTDPEPSALVTLVMTVTEAKALALAEAGIRADDGGLASGTSTDAVVVAATGRGISSRFGGPLSQLGALVARVAKQTLDAGIRRWMEEHA